MFYLTSKFHDNRVNTFGFMEGVGLLKPSPPPPPPRPRNSSPKEPRPNRVNTCIWGYPLVCSLTPHSLSIIWNFRNTLVLKWLMLRLTQLLALGVRPMWWNVLTSKCRDHGAALKVKGSLVTQSGGRGGGGAGAENTFSQYFFIIFKKWGGGGDSQRLPLRGPWNRSTCSCLKERCNWMISQKRNKTKHDSMVAITHN